MSEPGQIRIPRPSGVLVSYAEESRLVSRRQHQLYLPLQCRSLASHHSGAVGPWSRHLCWCRLVDAGARQTNGVAVLRRSPPIAPDPPSSADIHIPDPRSGSGTLTTRLRQCSTTHLPSATVRPHLWCVGDTALAVRPRTRCVQNRGANFHSASRQRATISGTSCRRRWPTQPTSASRLFYPTIKLSTVGSRTCFSGCRSSSLERSVGGRRLIVIIADKDHLFQLSYTLTWFFDRLTGIVTVVLVVMFVI